jgi:Na+/H+ antiporter NhaD/arsenite permease-like protein
MTDILIVISIVFSLGYLAIITEHKIQVDKAASALLTGVLCWTIYTLFSSQIVDASTLPHWFTTELGNRSTTEVITHWVGEHQLIGSLGEIASILFFLLGAMTIVELVDAYGGFTLITNRIQSNSTVKLLWIIGVIAFFMSAALDNLTTTIVMISLIRKLISDREERLFFAGMIVVAANAGGAWSPIGDVTTTMLWIGGQITTANIIHSLITPSLICMLVPLTFLSIRLRGQTISTTGQHCPVEDIQVSHRQRNIIFAVGVGGLLFVPIFKTLTHLPPFMGMLLSLSVLWVVSEMIDSEKDQATSSHHNIVEVLKRIDGASILFFLGILLAVAALEACGILHIVAHQLDNSFGDMNLIIFLIGLLSAVIDNVPLVAAAMGMYDMNTYPVDHQTWEFLALAAGTGGSCLIIGSAAGVAAMGMERINFFWYLRKISPLALMGYVSASAYYLYF